MNIHELAEQLADITPEMAADIAYLCRDPHLTRRHLNAEQQQLFDRLSDQEGLCGLSEQEIFAYAFRLGAYRMLCAMDPDPAS